jgi:hypothetical protein
MNDPLWFAILANALLGDVKRYASSTPCCSTMLSGTFGGATWRWQIGK